MMLRHYVCDGQAEKQQNIKQKNVLECDGWVPMLSVASVFLHVTRYEQPDTKLYTNMQQKVTCELRKVSTT